MHVCSTHAYRIAVPMTPSLQTCLPTCLPTYLPTYLPTHPPTHLPTHTPTHPPTYLPTHPLTHRPTYRPTDLSTDRPTYPPTYTPARSMLLGFQSRLRTSTRKGGSSPLVLSSLSHQTWQQDGHLWLCAMRSAFFAAAKRGTHSEAPTPQPSTGEGQERN